MPKKKKKKKQKESKKDCFKINITLNNTINIGNKELHIEQRAAGGGQINKNVGTNPNQGGQNALENSRTANKRPNFADGSGRSGIAGNDNDEAGGQQGIKVRDSKLIKSKIKSSSKHNESEEEQITEEATEE